MYQDGFDGRAGAVAESTLEVVCPECLGMGTKQVADDFGCISEIPCNCIPCVEKKSMINSEKLRPLVDSACVTCLGTGVHMWNDLGNVRAQLCPCVPEISYQDPKFREREKLVEGAQALEKSEIPPVFANATYAGKRFEEVAPANLLIWLDSITKESTPRGSANFLFMCGRLGNGKTHMSTDLIIRYVLKTGQPGRYVTATSLVQAEKDLLMFGTREFSEDKHRADYQRKIMQHAGIVVIDEITEHLKGNAVKYLESLIDKRLQSGNPTILISNHTFDSRTSLKGIPIQKIVGPRLSDRIRTFQRLELMEPSKRHLRDPKLVRVSQYTEEEVNNFVLPKSILAQKSGERHMLNWIARNPLFETIADKDRVQATENGFPLFSSDGVPIDADRMEPKVCRGVWQKGDTLIVSGPVLGIDDARAYLEFLEILKDNHCKGDFGLKIKLRFSEILEAFGKVDCKSNRVSLSRVLRRLSKASIDYSDSHGRSWIGPLISVYLNNEKGDVEISFNQSMITFYSSFEYTKFNSLIFESKIGTDGLRMQWFLRSHENPIFDKKDFEWWMRFLEKPVDEMDDSPSGKKLRRYHRRKFSELIRKQIDAGLLTPSSTLKRSSKIRLELAKVS